MGTIDMLGRVDPKRVQTYKEAMIEGAGSLNKALKMALEKISTVVEASENMRSNVNQYAAQGKKASGDAAIKELVTVNNGLKNVFEWFAGATGQAGDPTKQVKGYEKVDTSKMTTMESLDHIIESIIKKKLLK